MESLTINLQTLMIDGLERRSFTAAEFAEIKPPACPVCGAEVTIQRIDVTLNAEDEAARGRTYIAGMWACPRDCNPRTGQRRHFSQSVGRDMTGAFFECSCGVKETGLTSAEVETLRVEHPR